VPSATRPVSIPIELTMMLRLLKRSARIAEGIDAIISGIRKTAKAIA
jgi:hypothetical protein